jgi:hypothetical protein
VHASEGPRELELELEQMGQSQWLRVEVGCA